MKYIVAVSGGVDSIVLLHMLAMIRRDDSSLELVIAHANHGIRDNCDADAWHVATLARQHGLPFEVTQLSLQGKSEEEARRERYAWLHTLKKKHTADGIVTAHHADDQLETIVLNFMRGTGWRGLASLRTSNERVRPLLKLSKASIIRYALDNNLLWVNDNTNDDVRYTRNYIRHGVVPRIDVTSRQKLLELSKKQQKLREGIEQEVKNVVSSVRDESGLSRHKLIMMPDSVALEVLRSVTSGRHEPFQLRRLLHFAKTGRQGAILNLGKGKNALLTRQRLIV